MSERIQCLLIHVPDTTNNICHLIPIGMFGIADYLTQNKVVTKIIHVGIEKMCNKFFNIANFIRSQQIKIVCFDLHWHYQSWAVINCIKEIKKYAPCVKVIIGGYTASFFAMEIMRKFREVDFVVRGDAEVPLLKLIRAILNNNTPSNIPNILWRNKGRIIVNKQSYTIGVRQLNKILYSRFDLLKNYKLYIKPSFFYRITKVSLPFFYSPGRGCTVNCSFCGGSRVSQLIINKRKCVIMKSVKSALKDIENSKKYGINSLYMCFDPFVNRKHYIQLFKQIRKSGIKFKMFFECWSLPTKEFIDSFKETFEKGSQIILSPETGSDHIRKKNKGFFFSNKDFFSVMDYLALKKLDVILFFSTGLPFEKKENFLETINFFKRIKARYKNVRFCCSPIRMEPCSPYYLNEKKYCVKSKRKTFMDFYNASKNKVTIGYRTKYFSEKQIEANYILMEKLFKRKVLLNKIPFRIISLVSKIIEKS